MSIRYGVIGSGMMGQEHIRNIHLLPGAEVAAVADLDEGMRKAASALAGPDTAEFSAVGDLLSADMCDAYVIAAPNDTHHPILLDAMPGNKPLLIEKPLCTTSADCRDVIAKANGRTAPIWVAMEYRYMPPVARLLEELETGRAGAPRMMAIREHRFPFLPKISDWNRFNKRTGGTLVEKCCHFWDLMRLVMKSDPVRVFASGAADINHQDEVYDGATPDILDNAFVVLDFENGSRGMLDLCMFAEGSYWQEVISVTGEHARLDACVPGPARFSGNGQERHSELVISDRATKEVSTEVMELDEKILKAGDHHGSTYFQHRDFFQMVRSGGSSPAVTLQDGLWSVAIGEAAEESARTGQVIELDRSLL